MMAASRLSFGIILLLGSISINAQTQTGFKVKGIIWDSLHSKPLSATTVSLFKAAQPATPVATTLTNESGAFQLEVRDTGTFILETTFLNTKNQKQIIIGSDIDLGTVAFTQNAATLENVTVKTMQKVIEQTDDKIIYNVENDPSAKGLSTLDLFRRTPFLSVDGNDNVRMNGQTNFRVLLNGRETAMFAQNVSEALLGFPSATIMKIEVITNPSARYDAEGIGGIINIITKKKIEGYNGSVSTWSTTINQHVTSANFNAKFNNVGIAMTYGTRGNYNIPSGYTYSSIPTTPAFYSSRLLEGDRKGTFFSHFGNGEISVALDSMNTVSFYGNVSGGFSRQKFDLETVTVLNNSNTLMSNFDQTSRREFPTNTIGTDYIKKYPGKPDKEFSIRVNAELGKSDAFLESIENTSSYTRFMINNTIASNRQYTIQSDYIQPLAPGVKLEVGLRTTLRRAESDFQSRLKYNSTESYKVNTSNTDNFRFFQDVFGGYASYSFKIKTYNIRTGLRVEHTQINGSFASSKAFAKNSYTNVLPNFQISKRINDLSLVLSYNQRLQRPYITHLNPFIDNNDSLNVSFGNPDLDAQTIHTVQLQTRMQKGKTFLGLNFSGGYSDNMIVTLISFNPATGVRSNTFNNVGKDFLFIINGSVVHKFGENDKWQYNAQINFQYRTLRNILMPSQRNSGIAGNTSTGLSYTPNQRWSVNNYIGFEQAIIDLQSKPNTIPFCGSGVNFQAIPNKLRIGLMAQNYFAKYFDYTTVSTAPTFTAISTNHNLMGKVVFTALWNFGKLKEQVSKKKGVTIDDVLTVQ